MRQRFDVTEDLKNFAKFFGTKQDVRVQIASRENRRKGDVGLCFD
jgi:hypothetical protein